MGIEKESFLPTRLYHAGAIACEWTARISAACDARVWHSSVQPRILEEGVSRIKADFTTLTVALIPVAIVINIVVGQIVQSVLKLPIYLDSIGTVLVAVLAGPLAG